MENSKLSEFSKQKVTELFDQYFENNFPEKIKFNPTIIEYDDKTVKFGMKKHYGVLNMSAEKLLKTNLKMESRFIQEKIVLEKWDELINELGNLLEIAKNGGGTFGHKVGSMRDTQIKLRDYFK